jgi:hypothetical protein
MAWSYYSENAQTQQKINVDMLKALRVLEELSGEKLVYITDEEGNMVETNSDYLQSSMRQRIKNLEAENQHLQTRIELMLHDVSKDDLISNYDFEARLAQEWNKNKQAVRFVRNTENKEQSDSNEMTDQQILELLKQSQKAIEQLNKKVENLERENDVLKTKIDKLENQ